MTAGGDERSRAGGTRRRGCPWPPTQPALYTLVVALIRYVASKVPDRAIANNLISRFGLLDPTDGGRANRQSVTAEFQRSNGPSSIRATGFLLHNSLNLFSNFTYFLDDPEHGDQFEQAERRTRDLREHSRPSLRPASADRGRQRELEEHARSGMVKSVTGCPVERAWFSSCSTSSTLTRLISNTSTHPDSAGTRPRASTTSTPIRLCRGR